MKEKKMRKILLAVVTASLLTTSVFAETGTVSNIRYSPWAGVELVADAGGLTGGVVSLTGDGLKMFLAIALSAQVSGATVELTRDGSTMGWNSIKIISTP